MSLCTWGNEPHIQVHRMSYERVQERTGEYRYRKAGSEDEWTTKRSDDWWSLDKDVRLYVTVGDPNGKAPGTN